MPLLTLGAPAHALKVHISRATFTPLSLELSVPDTTDPGDIPDWDEVTLVIIHRTTEWASTLRSSTTYAAVYGWDLSDTDTDVDFDREPARLEYRVTGSDPQLVANGEIVVSG